jgi:conjugal transfer pilus assembly protein TraU
MRLLRLVLLVLSISLFSSSSFAEAYSCSGRIPNPVTDIAWLSIFPIKIGTTTIASYGQEDIGTSPPAICACPLPVIPWIRIGIGLSFWEPARAIEVTTTPFCSPILGGIPIGGASTLGKRGSAKTDTESRNSFYHVHWYIFPLTSWMQMLTDTICVTPESFDLLMLSELEPTWADDELSTIFSPESSLFANPIAQAACSADCIAASAGFPLNELFWCAGCQGSIYPMTGNVVNHESGIQASLLVTQRMHAKLHRAFVALDMNSTAAMCLPLPLPIINKRSYKTQMMYPIPNTLGAHPYGRSDIFWAAGKEFPVAGEDFSYLLWRRRVCCAF